MSIRERARASIVALVALVALDVALLLVNGRAQISNDTWFNLVTGREIAWHGLIRHNTLTVLARGVPVSDPQWLAHLAWYGIHRAAGFTGMLLLRAAISALTLALACAGSIRNGATPGRTAVAGLIVLPLVVTNCAIRAQAFGELCFVPFVALLCADQRVPSRRTWIAVALTVLWTNLHGSALLAIGFAALALASPWIDARRGFSVTRHAARDAALALAVVLAVFASPYAATMVPYFRASTANDSILRYNAEFQRPTVLGDPLVYLIAIVVVGAVVRARRSLRTFDIAFAFALVVLGLSAIRYGVFFALGAMLVLPRALDAALSPRFLALERLRGASGFAALASMAAIAAAFYAATTVHRAIERDLPVATANVIAQRAGRDRLVFASETYGDALLWHRPDLRGRVALDARLEILAARDIAWEAMLQTGRSTERLEPFALVAVDRAYWPALVRTLSASSAWRRVTEDPSVIVFESTTHAAQR